MIPEQEWGTAAAQQFIKGVGGELPAIRSTQTQQTVGCLQCLRLGVTKVPQVIYHLNGTSYCDEHVV